MCVSELRDVWFPLSMYSNQFSFVFLSMISEFGKPRAFGEFADQVSPTSWRNKSQGISTKIYLYRKSKLSTFISIIDAIQN